MEPAAYSVITFCIAHGISRSQFYKLYHQGLAPRIMRVGDRVVVSREAAADWRRDREEAAAKMADPLGPSRNGYGSRRKAAVTSPSEAA